MERGDKEARGEAFGDGDDVREQGAADVSAAVRGGVREAAGLLGVSTGRFTKLVSLDGKVLAEANRILTEVGMNSLK